MEVCDVCGALMSNSLQSAGWVCMIRVTVSCEKSPYLCEVALGFEAKRASIQLLRFNFTYLSRKT